MKMCGFIVLIFVVPCYGAADSPSKIVGSAPAQQGQGLFTSVSASCRASLAPLASFTSSGAGPGSSSDQLLEDELKAHRAQPQTPLRLTYFGTMCDPNVSPDILGIVQGMKNFSVQELVKGFEDTEKKLRALKAGNSSPGTTPPASVGSSPLGSARLPAVNQQVEVVEKIDLDRKMSISMGANFFERTRYETVAQKIERLSSLQQRRMIALHLHKKNILREQAVKVNSLLTSLSNDTLDSFFNDYSQSLVLATNFIIRARQKEHLALKKVGQTTAKFVGDGGELLAVLTDRDEQVHLRTQIEPRAPLDVRMSMAAPIDQEFTQILIDQYGISDKAIDERAQKKLEYLQAAGLMDQNWIYLEPRKKLVPSIPPQPSCVAAVASSSSVAHGAAARSS